SLQGRYTRIEDFYVRNHYDAPAVITPAPLRIEGEVEHPRSVSPDRLAALPQRKIGTVLECAGDPTQAVSLVSDGVWEGWALRDILASARPLPSGKYLHLSGRDGFSRSVPVGWAMEEGLLVTTLNGRPLTRNHGAPWRALFPGLYGMDSVKWLEKIVVASSPLPVVGYAYVEIKRGGFGIVEERPLPRVQVKSVITAPAEGAVLHRGQARVSGLAWSGSGKISSVNVSAGEEERPQPAALDRSASRYDWVLWSASFDLKRPGVVEFVAKATDSAGNTQPEERDPQRLDSYAYNVCDRVRCVVV
ncbi:MAG: molybdopterin-dependent oxidoreductase, partial [Terriglobia bacterium]